MRVLMTGGGTSGHVNPALAIAETVKLNVPGSEIAFVGTPRGIENKLVPKEGYRLYHVDVRGIRRKLTPSNLKAAYLAVTSPYKAKKIIKEFRPDVVVGTGGYVSWPVVKAAQMMGVPTVLHESNAFPGVAVKMLADKADRVLLNFAKTAEYLKKCPPEKLVVVGNPLRSGFSENADRAAARRAIGAEEYRYVILSYGGSMGAERVNEAVLAMMRDYTSKHPEILHTLAVGSIEFEAAKRMFSEYGLEGKENLRLVEYIYDMPTQMAAADLVICRAGAMTISEVAMMRRPAIFIPSPNVTENHQYKNAAVLADAGAAVITEERELAEDIGILRRRAEELIGDDERRRLMGEAAGSFAVKDANRRILNELRRLTGK